MSNKNTFGRREPLLHPRDYGKDNEFRRPNGNAVFAQNEVTGSPTIAFVYRRKKERRRTDPLPEIWSGFDSPYKTKEKGSGRKRRPKSAKSAKSRRSNRGSGVPSPYATPRRTLDYNGSIASSRRSSRPSTAPNERRARKSKFDIPKGRAETKDEAVIRRRKAALARKLDRIQTLRSGKRPVNPGSSPLFESKKVEEGRKMVGNYPKPSVIHHPSTANPEDRHVSTDILEDITDGIVPSQRMNIVREECTLKELFTVALPKQLLYRDLLFTVPMMELDLSYWPVNDAFLKSLADSKSNHKNITLLHIKFCTLVTDQGLEALDGCRSIKSLDISDIQNITDVGVIKFVKTHSKIEYFNLSGCQNITGTGIEALVMGCRHLNTLEIAQCNSVSDYAMQAIAGHSKIPFAAKMKKVNVAGCTNVSDAGMMQLITSLRGHVEYLNIHGAHGTTDIALSALHHHGPNSFKCLRFLDVSNMQLGDSGLDWISEGCGSGLIELNLCGCSKISDTGIQALAGRCTNITALNLSDCSLITDQTLLCLAKYLNGKSSNSVGEDDDQEGDEEDNESSARYTTLTKSVIAGESKLVETLLNNGADVNLKERDLTFPLYHACKHGHLDLALFLIQRKSEIKRKVMSSGENSLHVAARLGHLDIVVLLVGNGIDINATRKDGLTAMSIAASLGKIEVVNFLQKKGAEGDPGPGLQRLNIKDCKQVTDYGVASLGECKRLNTLVLIGVDHLTKRSLIALANSPASKSLTDLNVSGRYNVSNSGLNIFYGIASITDAGGGAISKMQNLTKLNLCSLFQVGHSSVHAIGKHCRKLQSLNISGCGNVTDSSLTTIATYCTRLSSLNVSGCVKISDEGMASLGGCSLTFPDIEPLLSLRELNLFRCSDIHDRGLLCLQKCSNLTRLNIRCCKWITDVSICDLVPCLPLLSHVNAGNLLDITSKSVLSMAKYCPSLQLLNISKCTDVDPGCLRPAAAILPLAQVASVATAGFNGLRPLAKGAYMRTRERYLKKQQEIIDAAKIIQYHWMQYCRRQSAKASLNDRRTLFRAFEILSAIKIQSMWRMYRYGKIAAINRREEIRLWNIKLENAVLLVQRTYRGHVGYFKFLGQKNRRVREIEAAIAIQALMRGFLAIRRAREWREALTSACVRVQRSFRCHSGRLHLILAREARLFREGLELEKSLRIQTAWRRYAAIHFVHNRRIKYNYAALRIQTFYRCSSKRRWFAVWRVKLLTAVKKVQNAYRMSDARFHLYLKKKAREFRDKIEKEAATIIQKHARRLLARHELGVRRERMDAATLLQKHYRARLYKRKIRFDKLYERYNKRADDKVKAKAKALYNVWREEERSTPKGRRLDMILRNGAAIIIQRTRRTILWNRNQMAIQRYQQFVKETELATKIQAVMRGFLGKRRFNEFKVAAHAAATRLKRWFTSLKVKWAYRIVLKNREAERRAAALREKRRLIQLAWERRRDALMRKIKHRSAALIQKHWRIHVEYEIRMAAARAALEAKRLEEQRIKEHQEEVAKEALERKTWKGKLKRAKELVSDPEKVRMLVKKAPYIALEKAESVLEKVEAHFDDEKKEQLEQEELKNMIYSIQARQKIMVAQTGVVDLMITVGQTELDNFFDIQKVHMHEEREYFEKVGPDVHHTAYKMSQGQKVHRPKYIQIWQKIGKERTAHILTDVMIVKPPKLHNKHEAELRRLELRKQGFNIVWNPKCKFEIQFRRDGTDLIRGVRTVTDARTRQKIVKQGWQKVEPSFEEFGMDEGCHLFLKHTTPAMTAKQKHAQTEALIPRDAMDVASLSMDGHSRQLLLEQVQFVGYSTDDIEFLRGAFHKMDADYSGTVDLDEFFEYVGELRTTISEHIFKFHDHPVGEKVTGEILDFGMFVKAISHFCLFDIELMARFFWSMIDPDGTRHATAHDVQGLLQMMDRQAPGVLSRNAMKLANTKLNMNPKTMESMVAFKDFYQLCVKMPPFLYPAFKLQHALQRKFLGQKYWEDKKVMMERARAMVKKMRDDGSDPNMQQSKKGDDVLKAGVSRKKRDRSRTKSGFKKK